MSEEEMKIYLKEMAKYDENINGDDIIAINGALELIDKLQKEIEKKDKVIDNLYADIEYEYSGTGYLKSLEEYYKEIENV